MMANTLRIAAAAAGLFTIASGQLALISSISGFRRFGACPSLGESCLLSRYERQSKLTAL